MKLKSFCASLCILCLPLVSFAQTTTSTSGPIAEPNLFTSCSAGIKDLTDILYWIGGCIVGKGTVMLIVAIALIVFMLGVLRFIYQGGSGNADYAKKLREYLMWSLIALTVMLSVWGIVYFIGGTLGIGQGGNAPIPQFTVTK